MKIYFAGKVPKGDEIGQLEDWRASLTSSLKEAGEFIEMISPEDPELDESDSLAVFGHDCLLIRMADMVIVNADQKLGVGTAQEMIIAKYFEKPVLTILPRDTHHRRTNLQMHEFLIKDWKHPFIVSTSDAVFDSVEHLKEFIASGKLKETTVRPKNIDIINQAIDHYHKHYPHRQ
jgi:nucleoside 2-deoxyribosyltransferase